MVIMITSTVATVIQAVSPLLGTGAGAAAGAAAAGAAVAAAAAAGAAAAGAAGVVVAAAAGAVAAGAVAAGACAMAATLPISSPRPRPSEARSFLMAMSLFGR